MILRFARKNSFAIVLLVSAILLSVASVHAQVEYLGVRFLKIQQEKAHEQMMAGIAGNPWQYRILADLLVEPLIVLFKEMDLARPPATAFIVFRFVQNLLIFLLSGIYHKKLGLNIYANLIGLSLSAYAMSQSLYNSDLSFSVYFDVAFYLLAASLILSRKFFWIVPVMILAAFNRETSALIPFMLAAYYYFNEPERGSLKPAVIVAVISFVIFTVIFFGLRLYYGEQPFITADGFYPGLGTLYMNVTRWITWKQLAATLGLVPFLAVFGFRKWPPALKIFFWVIVPVWFAVHWLAAIIAETRILLVPHILVFIPGALFAIFTQEKAAP